jgi:hypothetical protein
VATDHTTANGIKREREREQLVADVSAPDEPMVNGIKATVHPTALKKLTERFLLRSLQHRIN